MATGSSSNIVPNVPGYILAERLGSGSYATVYKAFATSGIRGVVAVKCIKISSLNKAASDNLISEIGILKSAKHEHIVELKDFIYDKQHVFLIMEYCSGGDLSMFIRAKRCLSEGIVKRFLQQLASALQYLRAQSISHMDLKPQNILLSSSHDPRLKLADFGFAQHLSAECVAVHMRGSPLYMAPEIVCDKKYDARVDLWSLGVILYECLFGRAPFASKTFTELAEKMMDNKAIEIPTDIHISAPCKHLLGCLLQRNPDDRICFDDFFNHPFLDLEHAPSGRCLGKAVELVSLAIQADTAGDIKLALELYSSSLEYFLPALHYERMESNKKGLRSRIQQYMNRAEELKTLLKTGCDSMNVVGHEGNSLNSDENCRISSDNENEYTELMKLYEGDDKVVAAVQVAHGAEFLEVQERYEEAVDKYQRALAILLEAGRREKGSRRKELLYKYISKWMTHAEQAKSYVKLSKLLRDTEETAIKDSFIKEQCRIH